MNKELDRLHIEIDLFRQVSDPKNVLVCFSADYHSEQRHLIQSSAVPVSTQSMVESAQKIVSRLIRGSVFNSDADRPGTTQDLPEPETARASEV